MKVDTYLPGGSASSNSGERTGFPVLLLIWAFVSAMALALFLANVSSVILLLSFTFIIATVPLAGLHLGPVRWFHPMIMVTLPAVVGIWLRSIYLVYDGNSDGAKRLLLGQDTEEVVARGSLVAAVGLVSLTLAFFLTRSESSGTSRLWFPTDWSGDSGRSTLVIICSLVIGVIATLLYIRAIGGVSLDAISGKRYIEVSADSASSGAFISRAASVPALASLPILSAWSKGRPPSRVVRLLVVLAILSSALVPFIASSRAEIIAIFLVCGITWSFSRPMRVATLALISLLAVGVLFSMGSLRCEYQSGSTQSCGVSNEIEGSLLANENWLSVSKTYHIYRKVPSVVDFQYGRTMIDAVLAPVPRTLWPSKPSVRSDILVGFQILELPPSRRTGASPGFIGELYLNFGFPAVILGMAALGYILRRLWRWVLATRSDFAIIVFALAAVHLALRLPQGDFTGSLLPLGQGVAVVGTVLWLGQRKSSVSSGVSDAAYHSK